MLFRLFAWERSTRHWQHFKPGLASVLENFYGEVCKKNTDEFQVDDNENSSNKLRYKNTTLKSICSALVWYFKQIRSIDIIKNENFIHANEVFRGIQQINKSEGFGEIKSIPSMTLISKLMDYFCWNMQGLPNAKHLQEICLFYVLFYTCCHGRENLRSMTKSTYSIEVDPEDGRRIFHQNIDEADKNHSYLDTKQMRVELMKLKVLCQDFFIP